MRPCSSSTPSTWPTGSRPGSRSSVILLVIPAGGHHPRLRLPVQDDEPHAEPARPHGGRPPRRAPAAGRRREVPPEGGHLPREGRPHGLRPRPAGRADLHVPALRGRARRARPRRRGPRHRHLLRLGRVVHLGHRRAHGGLGLGQQVRPDRRPAGGGPAHRLRAAPGAGRGRRGHPGRHPATCRASSSPRPTAPSSASTPSATRSSSPSSWASSSSWPPCRPSSPRRRSTCRWPSPRSSAATRSSTPASASCSSSWASSPPPSPSPRIASVLFLGGWWVPGFDPTDDILNVLGPAVLFAKIMFVSFLIFWVRFTFPRFREDQLQAFAWKCADPAAPDQHRGHRRPEGGVLMPQLPGLVKGLGVTFRDHAQARRRHRAVPPREGGADAPGPRRDRPQGGELHRLHALCPGVPGLVHLHRGPQVPGPAPAGGRQAPPEERARPLRHRLRPLHVLRHLRRGLPFEALFWSPEYEYSEHRIADLLHDKDRLDEWMETVPDFEAYEAGREVKAKKVPR